MKKCKDCLQEKPLNQFHKNEKWYRNRCKKCHNAKYAPATGKPNAGRFKKGHKSNAGFKKGMIPWNKGLKLSSEFGEKISIAKRRKAKNVPPKSLDELSGTSRNGGRARKWKFLVKQRDGFLCTICFTNLNLHAHHIVPWKDNEMLRFDVNNGITLCNSCHIKEERKITPTWNKGKKLTAEHVDKLRKSKVGHVPWNKGKKAIPTGNFTVT